VSISAEREEALRRDHRRLGKELGLFSDEVGPGLPLWTPRNGVAIAPGRLPQAGTSETGLPASGYTHISQVEL